MGDLLDGNDGARADALADIALDDVGEVLLAESVAALRKERLGKASFDEVVFELCASSDPPVLAEIEWKELDRLVTPRQHAGQLARQKVGVRAGDHEVIASRPLELRPQPFLPADHGLDLVEEEVGVLQPRVAIAERGDPLVEQAMIELHAQSRILEVEERAVLGIDAVALHELGQQSRLAAAPHPLHDEHERIPEPRRHGHVPRDRFRNRPIPEAPVRRDVQQL